MSKDYYAILGVTKSANNDEIKKAFRKLAHKFHPDKKGGDEARFKEVSEAFSILSDNKKRNEYDTYGRVFSEGGAPGGGAYGFGGASGFSQADFQDFDLGDIFGQFFQGGGSGQRVQRGRDISIDLEIPFRDSIFGITRKILLTKQSECKTCKGTGAKEGSEFKTCKHCNGNGKIHETKRSMLGTFSSTRMCDTCHGAGKEPKDKCGSCRGQGILRQEEEITINVPSGMDNGEMIRLSGGGEVLRGGQPGDLYVKVHVRPDSVFVKEGMHLVRTLKLKLSDALLGGKYTVETLDGDIEVSIPAGISHGEILRIRDKGVPVEKNNRGDLLIKISITLPKKLSRKARKAIEELRKEGV